MSVHRDFLPGPSSEQLGLADAALRFLTDTYSLSKRRRTIASAAGFDRETWLAFAHMGWLSIPFLESDGGLGGGPRELGCIMAALGKAAVLEPYLDAVVLTGTLLAACPPSPVRTEMIAATISGRGFATVALHDLRCRGLDGSTNTQAKRVPGGIELSGHLSLVPFAGQSEVILVPARIQDCADTGPAIYAVRPAEAEVRGYATVDGGLAADIVLDAVRIADTRLVAEPAAAAPALAHAVRVATYCLCVEAVAVMDELICATVDHLQNRMQFGRPLAQFQALQHAVADMTISHAQADAATWMAGHVLDTNDGVLRDRLLAAAKYEVGRCGRYIGQRTVQLHGAIGMTDEFVVGHHFKRLIGIDLLFGGWLSQQQRFAALGERIQT